MIIVTADHGGTPEGGHGGDSDEELKTGLDRLEAFIQQLPL